MDFFYPIKLESLLLLPQMCNLCACLGGILGSAWIPAVTKGKYK